MPTIHLLIKGSVQGVYYRASASEIAKQLNLTGWIKNTTEGDVEAMVSGTQADVNKFIEWCKKGPPAALVKEVITTKEIEQHFENFSIIRR